MRRFFVLLGLVSILMFSVSAQAKRHKTDLKLEHIENLTMITQHLELDAPVIIEIKNNTDKSCLCACDTTEGFWICTSNECKYDDKTCHAD